MKKKILCLLSLLSISLWAQELTPEQQRQLLKDVQALKAKVNALEGKSASGLKKVNYENETSETKSTTSTGPSLSTEEQKKIMDEIGALKVKQEEAQKMLDELDQEP